MAAAWRRKLWTFSRNNWGYWPLGGIRFLVAHAHRVIPSCPRIVQGSLVATQIDLQIFLIKMLPYVHHVAVVGYGYGFFCEKSLFNPAVNWFKSEITSSTQPWLWRVWVAFWLTSAQTVTQPAMLPALGWAPLMPPNPEVTKKSALGALPIFRNPLRTVIVVPCNSLWSQYAYSFPPSSVRIG